MGGGQEREGNREIEQRERDRDKEAERGREREKSYMLVTRWERAENSREKSGTSGWRVRGPRLSSPFILVL